MGRKGKDRQKRIIIIFQWVKPEKGEKGERNAYNSHKDTHTLSKSIKSLSERNEEKRARVKLKESSHNQETDEIVRDFPANE